MSKCTVVLLVMHGMEQHFVDIVEETCIYFKFDMLMKLCNYQVIFGSVFNHPIAVVDDSIVR